jgi:hypothetical protein
MAGGRPIPVSPIVPFAEREVEADRAGNARFGFGVQAQMPEGIMAGNISDAEREPPDSGPTPFGPLMGKR